MTARRKSMKVNDEMEEEEGSDNKKEEDMMGFSWVGHLDTF